MQIPVWPVYAAVACVCGGLAGSFFIWVISLACGRDVEWTGRRWARAWMVGAITVAIQVTAGYFLQDQLPLIGTLVLPLVLGLYGLAIFADLVVIDTYLGRRDRATAEC